MKRVALALCLVARGGLAAAQTVSTEDQRPRNAISIEPASLAYSGVEFYGERYFFSHRLSLVGGLGWKWPSGGDYATWSVSTGLGARLWLNRFQPAFQHHLGGPFAGVRFDTALTHVSDRLDGLASSNVDLAWSLRAGYRFVVLDRIEITPEAGAAVTLGLNGIPVLAGVPRLSWVFGGTLGYLF